jgi:predicted metalloprotease with PDZ domain
MRALWTRYGRDFYSDGAGAGQGIGEGEALRLFEEVSGISLKRYFDRHIQGTDDVPLEKLLAPFAVSFTDKRKNGKPSLGARTVKEGNDCKLANVYEGGAAHLAGLSALDLLVAIDGLRVTPVNLDALMSRYGIGDAVTVHAFRRDELMTFEVVLKADDAAQVSLASEAKPAAAARLRGAWLGRV